MRDAIPEAMPVATPIPRLIHVASTAEGFMAEVILRIIFQGSIRKGTVHTPASRQITYIRRICMDHLFAGIYEYRLLRRGIFLRICMKISDSVPIGHTVEQYILPKIYVSTSHTRRVPITVVPADRIICVFCDTTAIGCTCGPIIRYATVAMKNIIARNMRKMRICLISCRAAVSAARGALPAADAAFLQAAP